MKLILSHDDGEVIEVWEIERDFGDLNYSMPRHTLLSDVTNAWERANEKSSDESGKGD